MHLPHQAQPHQTCAFHLLKPSKEAIHTVGKMELEASHPTPTTSARWAPHTAFGFVAGVLATLLLAVSITKYQMILVGWRRLVKLVPFVSPAVASTRWSAARVEDQDLGEDRENKTNHRDEAVAVSTTKPFELRERLWHEPPELHYEMDYGHFDAVQRKFKELGGRVLNGERGGLIITSSTSSFITILIGQNINMR